MTLLFLQAICVKISSTQSKLRTIYVRYGQYCFVKRKQEKDVKRLETKLFPLLQKQRHMSAFMKLYGNEVKFMEVKQDVVDQLARDVSDLLLGKVNQLEYPGEGKNLLYALKRLQFRFYWFASRLQMICTL